MNKHLEAAAAAINAYMSTNEGWDSRLAAQAAIAAYLASLASLASAGEDGVIAEMCEAHFAAEVSEGELHYETRMRAALAVALAVARAAMDYGWSDGTPPKWFDEWFIAETTHGDRVVLQALPEEYTYDYETADRTFYKADTIKRWMQFPDSQFKPLNAVARASMGEVERDAGVCSREWDDGAQQWLTDCALSAEASAAKDDAYCCGCGKPVAVRAKEAGHE